MGERGTTEQKDEEEEEEEAAPQGKGGGGSGGEKKNYLGQSMALYIFTWGEEGERGRGKRKAIFPFSSSSCSEGETGKKPQKGKERKKGGAVVEVPKVFFYGACKRMKPLSLPDS